MAAGKIKAYLWSFIERFLFVIINFSLLIYLARILEPEVFGGFAIFQGVLFISLTFIDGGLFNAIIQKGKKNNQLLISSYYFVITMVTLFIVVVFLFGEQIFSWLGVDIVGVQYYLILCMLFSALSTVNRVVSHIELNFKVIAKVGLIASIFSSSVCVIIVFIWETDQALYIQFTLYQFLTYFLLRKFVGWRPDTYKFSLAPLLEIKDYSLRIFVANLINNIYRQIYPIIIGKYYSLHHAGIFSQAENLSRTPSYMLASVIQRVIFPILSQGSNKEKESEYIIVTNVSAQVFIPIMTIIGVYSDFIVDFLLGPGWGEVYPILSLLAFASCLNVHHVLNATYLQSEGFAKAYLNLEVLKKFMLTFFIIASVDYGIIYLCVAIVINSILVMIINSVFLHYVGLVSFIKQIGYVLPIYIVSLFILIADNLFSYDFSKSLVFIYIILFFINLLRLSWLIITKKKLIIPQS
ncbi:oligosaccharide flippase family protein [Vibrio splendidus]